MTKKVLTRVFDVAVLLLALWIALSYFDIISDNTTLHATHSDFNIFNIFLWRCGN